MKRCILLISFLLSTAAVAFAQVTVEAATPTEAPKFKDEVKQTNDTPPEYTSEAKIRAERAALRKERNLLEVNAGISGSLSSFNSQWKSVNGSVNTITAIAHFLLTHNYHRGHFTLDNKASFKLGATCQSSAWTKSQDEWFISTAPAYKMSDKWNFGAILSLRSQFANGFNSNRNITSACFAPAYLSISVGFTYVCPNPKFPIKINLSPVSLSATYVTNEIVHEKFFNDHGFTDSEGNKVFYEDYVQDKSIVPDEQKCTPYLYGLTLGNKSSRYEGGSSIQIDFDRKFGKKGIFRYRTTLYSFYGWMNEIIQQTSVRAKYYNNLAPVIRWEHTVDIAATKHFSTQFYLQLYYNEAQISSIQTQMIFGVGLSYNFKNK